MKKILTALSLIAAFASCKKSETPNQCQASAATIAGTYKVTSIKYKASAGTAETDMYASLPDCQKDDEYKFNADGSLSITDAGVSCNLPPLPGLPNSWVLENNNTALRLSDLFMTIISFDCSKLVVTENNTLTDGDVKTTTFTKQ